MKLIKPITLVSLALSCTSPSIAQRVSQQEMPIPQAVGAVPSEAQIAWHKLETYAFIHFGLNTFNDLEWGYGNTPTSTFNLKTLDTDQWVRTLKQAGMRAVLLTTKHHDGFCLWPTKTTDYSVKNSPWKDGKGDLVRELSNSCKKYGLKFGIYLSPWDRHHPEYARQGYQEVFHEQIRELTSNYGELFEYWFDGANGGTGWYGGADESRSIEPQKYYKYEEAAEILRNNNPNIMIFGGTVPTIRWIGNESGWAGETNYATYSLEKEKHYKENIWGHRGGREWLPGEVDVSIRPGWFYHPREDHQVRSVANLTNIYYQSVGRNANLLLNFPVDLEGRIPASDSTNAVRWYRHIQKSFEHNLAHKAQVKALNTRLGKTFVPKHLIDGNSETYWATTDSVQTAEIELLFPRKQSINTVMLQEYIRLGQRIESFTLEYRDQSNKWRPIATKDSLTTVGYKRLIRFRQVGTKALRLKVDKSMGPVCLAEFGAFLTPELVDAPLLTRDENDKMTISPATPSHNPNYRMRYRINKGKWQEYQEPVTIPSNHLSVEVEARTSSNRASKVYTLGYSAKSYSIRECTPEQQAKLRDGNGYTSVQLNKSIRSLTFDFVEPSLISTFVYTPDQRRDASGHIQKYRLFVDGVLAMQGEFQNIKANPIPTELKLPHPIKGRSLRLEVDGILDNKTEMVIGDIAIY